ncbi:uncharacterized protein Dwil_GK19057 [Drosophila willistoni]|uniref:MD-2-related lipid-recognition domain-containing protein n=1 Tax=Drosophila willistoni TaxID=7260 RepID=B4MUF7_DROWI|nr:uncharacterized protein LOC6642094 [Drosophila willistoni]EDW76083.2 uncharacterized protein Dwil_GK19057 [Drosophila willistoni]
MTGTFLFSVLVIGFATFLEVETKINAYFTKVECINQWPELMPDLSCYSNSSVNGESGSFSAEFTLAENVKELSGIYIVGIQRGKLITNYTASEMNFCVALETVQNNYLLKMIADELRRVGNFPLQCPFKKKHRYYLKDYRIDTKLIPSYTPDLTFVTDCVIATQKRTIFRFKTYGRVFKKSGKSGR